MKIRTINVLVALIYSQILLHFGKRYQLNHDYRIEIALVIFLILPCLLRKLGFFTQFLDKKSNEIKEVNQIRLNAKATVSYFLLCNILTVILFTALFYTKKFVITDNHSYLIALLFAITVLLFYDWLYHKFIIPHYVKKR
ncbi:hypothetical protein [Avibacterium paragallinarum]|uniref:hypothetical protein n=1 Tax=Avibacterium paragallinarum TaxID=728 RepID=UPI001029A89A